MKKLYLIVFLMFAMLASYSQQAPVVSFDCHDENNNPQRLDSVRIENWTRSWAVTIYYPNLSISLGDVTNGITDLEFDEEGLARNIPNPFNGRTHAQLTLSNNEHIIMRAFDITGKAVAYYEGQLEVGKHDFDIVLSTPQTYILQVATSKKSYAIKMVNTGRGGEDKISLLASNNEVVLKSARQIMDYDFEAGDCMHYQGFVTVGNEAVRTNPITQNQYQSELITFTIQTEVLTVTTNTVSNIYATTATCGGTVTATVDAIVISRGVCWSTSSNPTVNDNHTIDGNGTGSFTSNITGLIPGTIYYVRAYATNSSGTAYGSQVFFTTTSSGGTDGQPCHGAITVMDIDNNTYNTVQIGNQCWMKENLRTTRYADGTFIELDGIHSNITPYRYNPGDNADNVPIYGYLYNWPAVMHGANSSNSIPSAVQGICPDGWHVPSSAEWGQLIDYVRSQSQYLCGSNSCIAKALASTTGWYSINSSCFCEVGCHPYLNNSTGFSAFPAGEHYTQNLRFGDAAIFWSATEYNAGFAIDACRLECNEACVDGGYAPDKGYGYSVRCLYGGQIVVSTNTVSNITSTSAISGGEITADGGSTVIARGVCWSTSPNPTVNDSHTIDGNGIGSFTSNITGLMPGTLYYIRAYATNNIGTGYGNEESFITQTISVQPCPGFVTVTDNDGNIYNTVQIGNQCWMKDNLRTTRYADGTTIPLGPLGSSTSITTPYRYNPNNDSSNVSAYGYLYNWPAVMHGASSSASNPSGVQGICPSGWHVPSDAEWTQLTNYVGSQPQFQCYNSSDKIAKALASTTGWNSSTNTCAVGNYPSTNNATDFSAFPAGIYNNSGNYVLFGGDVSFWSATAFSDHYAYYRYLDYNDANVYRYNNYMNYGFSVRCVRDSTGSVSLPTVTTNTVSNISATFATCGGNVTSDGVATVTARGVCWSTSQNPTVSDSHTTNGSGTGSFTSSITGLAAGTTYYVRAYATNSAGTAYGSQVNFTTTSSGGTAGQPCPGAATVTDIDNNTYNTVQIGNQCWMKENLRTTHFANGASIALGSSTSTTTAYRYNPNDNANNVSTYGYLYNWAAVMHGASSSSANPSGVQGICPNGWHVPSDAEWTQLTNYVGSQPQYQCGNNSENIAKALASTTGWNSSSNTCAVGNNPNANNATGFSVLPAGGYYSYEDFGYYADFWSATEGSGGSVYDHYLGYGNSNMGRYYFDKYNGFSVRCVRD